MKKHYFSSPLLPTQQGIAWNSFSSLFLSFFLLSRAMPTAYGSFQARGQTGATAACHSHSNAGPEPCLQPIPQLMAMPDPRPTE